MGSHVMKDKLLKVIDELIAMDHDEFHKLLKAYEPGDIAEFLMDMGAIEAMFPDKKKGSPKCL